MKKTVRAFCLYLVLIPVASSAQWVSVGNVTGVQSNPSSVEISAAEVKVRIDALSPRVIRVRYTNGTSAVHRESFAVVGAQSFHAPTIQVQPNSDAVEFSTGVLRVRVTKSPLRIAFLTPSGDTITADAAPAAFQGSAFRVWKQMPIDEHYFGLGDKAGPIDHRDQAFTMWNTDAYGWRSGTDPLYKSIPFFLALRAGAAYGIFLDNTYRSSFDFGKASRDRYSFGSDGGDLDYYFFYGPDPKQVIADYTALVGRTPLPPLWSLGYQQSRYSYETEARVREIASEFRSRHIPADVIYLDIDYESERRPFTIDRTRFPNFEGMVRELGAAGFKLIPIVDLHLKQEPGYKPYDEGLAGDHFVKNADGSLYVGPVWPGPSVFPDFTRASSRAWWGSLFQEFSAMGVRGIWNDMNEPSVFVSPDKTMPLTVVHRVQENGESRTTDHREIHNVFGMENARGTYEGLLRSKPDLRPFVLTRAAYPGSWRYAATWTGDNSATWEHYRLSIPTLLSLGVSGYTFSGVDVGGYAGSPTAELLTRWIELGVFLPFYRNHTEKGSRDQEPWVHGPEHEAIRRRYIELRYRLLPYIYTGMEEASRDGLPLMRPLFLEYPSSKDLVTNDREFLFGRDLLIAPKVQETMDAYTVNLPEGSWYDFWTGVAVPKAPAVHVDPALDSLPIYVRAGAIIPMQPVVQNTTEVPHGPLQLLVYPGPDCRGSLYLDDGETFAYQHNQFYRAEFTCQSSGQEVRVRAQVLSSAFRPWWTEINLIVAGFDSAPAGVTAGGKIITGWTYDQARHAVSITVPAAAITQELVIR